VGNGQTGHMRWDTIDAIVRANFWPDTVSTDWNTNAHQTGVIDLPNCASKLLMLGMPMDRTIAAMTATAAKVFPVFRDRGTLAVDAPADIAILELRSGQFEFQDNFKGTRMGKQRLFPSGTILGGKRITT
jgi:dihydroorotase